MVIQALHVRVRGWVRPDGTHHLTVLCAQDALGLGVRKPANAFGGDPRAGVGGGHGAMLGPAWLSS